MPIYGILPFEISLRDTIQKFKKFSPLSFYGESILCKSGRVSDFYLHKVQHRKIAYNANCQKVCFDYLKSPNLI